MRSILLASVLTVAGAGTALAQMCGAGMQQGQTAQSGGMRCMGMSAQADDPMANKPANKPTMGMKACCRNMAGMMGGMKQEGQVADPHKGHQMPMPKP